MGGSRRKLKKNRAKVQVGLPRKKPNVFKPAVDIPDRLLSGGDGEKVWNNEGSVIQNYRTFGVVANPNIVGVRARTQHIVQDASLQVPPNPSGVVTPFLEFEPIDSGSDLETDDLKSVLGKKRRDGKHAPPQPLTKMQRIYEGKLVEKYGDNFQAMFMDTKLNEMQHSVATLTKLCQRYHLSSCQTSRFKIRKCASSDASAIATPSRVRVIP